MFLNLPSGLGSSDERAVWATSDNQLSAEAAEELEPRKGRRHASPCNLGAQAVSGSGLPSPRQWESRKRVPAKWKRQSTSSASMGSQG